jgi:hypothetical protein
MLEDWMRPDECRDGIPQWLLLAPDGAYGKRKLGKLETSSRLMQTGQAGCLAANKHRQGESGRRKAAPALSWCLTKRPVSHTLYSNHSFMNSMANW